MAYDSIIKTGLTPMSQGWKDYLENKTVNPDGTMTTKEIVAPSTQDTLQAYYDSKGGRAPYTPPSAPATPTIAETLNNIQKQALDIQSQIPGATGLTQAPGTFQAPTPETSPEWKSSNLTSQEEEAIRRAQLKMFRGQIDATNQIYDQMLSEARMQGQGRLGSVTALGARSGILGSDFANSQRDTMVGYNNEINRGIQAERSAKIGAIMGEARSSAAAEIAAKNTARKQDADSYIEYLKGAKERKTENLSKLAGALVLQGIDPSSMDKKELDGIAKSYGVSVEDIMYSYQTKKSETDAATAAADLETRKTESEIAKNGRVELSEGSALLDAEGNVIYKNPKTYAPSDGGVDLDGLTTRQQINLKAVTTAYQGDKYINGAQNALTAKTIANQVLSNPDSAPEQLKSLYVLVKNLDPDSAVREGEIKLTEQAQSYLDTFQTSITRITEGRIIAPNTAAALANATIELASAWEQAANRRQNQYKAQASVLKIGEPFGDYLSAFDSNYLNQNYTGESEGGGTDLSTMSDEELERIANGG
jgi:hypothetical protein